MTDKQYARWKDFARRMARTCFRGSRRPTSLWIIERVEEWFSNCDNDYSREWTNYNSWDQDDPCLTDAVSEFFNDWLYTLPALDSDEAEYLACEQFLDQWLGPVVCCIRAGIDCACESSAGVLGFTAGDLRRMFPEGVPDWVFPPNERLRHWLTDKLNGTFAELPDDADVVL